MLVKLMPSPVRRIVGTLNDGLFVLRALGIEPIEFHIREELEAIDVAMRLYWKQKDHSYAAVAEYERGRERLEQIRGQMS
jgi:hypothetical protein